MQVCEVCGTPVVNGFTDGDIRVCESHFEQYMGQEYGTWRENDHDDAEHWSGGFYDFYEPREDAWRDTGIYWTEGLDD